MGEIEAKPDEKPLESADPPNSIIQASVDDKGRLKLPVEFLGYLDAIGADKVFITTLDLKLARIYPLAVWKHNQQICSTAGENAAAAARLAFLAKVYGGDAEIDKAGRVLLPARLREALGLEKQPVWLDYYNEHIKVFTRQVYEERMQLSVATMGEDFRTLEKIGFK